MKNKKSIVFICLLLIVILVGITYAYFSNSASFDNIFKASEYKTTIIENFESPTNWKPGDTTEKKINVTNNGEGDVAVRVCIDANEGTWTSKNGTTWANTKDNAAIINETSSVSTCDITNANWRKITNEDGGYCYYYTKKLSSGETTNSSPVESVTYNSEVEVTDSCTTTKEDGKTSVTCSSTGDGYDNATYNLPIKVETIQIDGMDSEWGIDLEDVNSCELVNFYITGYGYNNDEIDRHSLNNEIARLGGGWYSDSNKEVYKAEKNMSVSDWLDSSYSKDFKYRAGYTNPYDPCPTCYVTIFMYDSNKKLISNDDFIFDKDDIELYYSIYVYE